MIWSISVDPNLTYSTTTWAGTDIPSVTIKDPSGTSFSKIYTTVGTKTVYATTTGLLGPNPYITACQSTTTVIMDKGSVIEI